MAPTRPVSDAFLAAVRGSHGMAVRARVAETFQTGVNPAGEEVDVIGGAVSLDGTANIRSTVDVTVDGTGMWPYRGGRNLLAPYGNELFVERGIRLGGGGTEWVSLGYFRIEAPEQSLPPDGPIRVSGSDRMAGIIDARLLTPRQYLPSATYGDVVDDLVTEVYPSATIIWDDATDLETIGRAQIAEDNRYQFLHDLVTSLGKVCYWNYRGELLITGLPDPSAPVYDIDAGSGGVLIYGSMTRHLARDGVYNAAVAAGEAADEQPPVRAVAVDDDPASPTYFYGRFGPVPTFFTSSFMTTADQCTAAARALLQRSTGLPYSIDFGLVPNPALEPGDPVRVKYSVRDTAEVHVLQTVKVPLTAADSMKATTREQAVTIVGGGE